MDKLVELWTFIAADKVAIGSLEFSAIHLMAIIIILGIPICIFNSVMKDLLLKDL